MKKLISSTAVLVFTLIFATGFAVSADKAPVIKTSIPPAVEKKADVKQAVPDKEELLDINSATEEQLKKIPGIGDEYSKKIIAGRPYAKKDQLMSRKILSMAIYEKIKDKIIAKQIKTEGKKQGK
jgi:competence protein ComEA